MASTLDVTPFLRTWIIARCPGFESRVYPAQGIQDDTSPYAVITTIDGERYTEQAGPDTLNRVVMRVDVWSIVRRVGVLLSDRIAGAKGDPGLDGYRGEMVTDGIDGDLFLERVNMEPNSFEGYEAPRQGQKQGWHRQTRDYSIYFNEELR